jgi:hypothetical protein
MSTAKRLVVYNPDEDDQRAEVPPRPTYSNDYSYYNQIPLYHPPSKPSLSVDSDLSPGGSRFPTSCNLNGSSPTQHCYNGESQCPARQILPVGPPSLTVGSTTNNLCTSHLFQSPSDSNPSDAGPHTPPCVLARLDGTDYQNIFLGHNKQGGLGIRERIYTQVSISSPISIALLLNSKTAQIEQFLAV